MAGVTPPQELGPNEPSTEHPFEYLEEFTSPGWVLSAGVDPTPWLEQLRSFEDLLYHYPQPVIEGPYWDMRIRDENGLVYALSFMWADAGLFFAYIEPLLRGLGVSHEEAVFTRASLEYWMTYVTETLLQLAAFAVGSFFILIAILRYLEPGGGPHLLPWLQEALQGVL